MHFCVFQVQKKCLSKLVNHRWSQKLRKELTRVVIEPNLIDDSILQSIASMTRFRISRQVDEHFTVLVHASERPRWCSATSLRSSWHLRLWHWLLSFPGPSARDSWNCVSGRPTPHNWASPPSLCCLFSLFLILCGKGDLKSRSTVYMLSQTNWRPVAEMFLTGRSQSGPWEKMGKHVSKSFTGIHIRRKAGRQDS